MTKPTYEKSNLTLEERISLKNLSERTDIIIHSADKGGKIVIMDRSIYIQECEKQLENKEFYNMVKTDPTNIYVEEIKTNINDMLQNEIITNQQSKFLSQHLENPRIPVFYGLPKIHKLFKKFPPLRPIVSHLNSNSCKLSEFIDSFLKYQAKRCKSFIRDTKDFLLKLKSIGKLPPNSILVTMDVSSLYTNINHEEGAQACFEKLQQRKNKRIPSLLLKNLILIVLKSNVFRFGNSIYQQIKGTAMGTPMAPNYANLFMDKFERTLIDDYRKKNWFNTSSLVPIHR